MKKTPYIDPRRVGKRSLLPHEHRSREAIERFVETLRKRVPPKGVDGWHPAWTN